MAMIFTSRAPRAAALLVVVGAFAAACSTMRPALLPLEANSYFIAPVFTGDTVAAFAKRYDAQVAEVQALNSITDPNATLTRGFMRVPMQARSTERSVATTARPAAATPTPAAAAAAAQPAATTARFPRLQARPSAIEARPLAPPLAGPNRGARTEAVPPSPRPAPAVRTAASSRMASAVSVAAVEKAQPDPAPAAEPAQSTWADWMMPETPAEAVVEDPRFVWPVEGRIISSFGLQPGGGRNDGINIAVAHGVPVRAAEAGEVSYVGNELKGYGNLILIRHDNGFVSAYAHNDGVHVARGDRVDRGQVIGSAGDTGDVTSPQLHFELRRGTTPVDPTLYLREGSSERLAEGSR